MENSESIYEQVAERCSSFAALSKETFINRAYDMENISCTNCSHFDSTHHCILDLYDRIVAANQLEED